MVKGLKGPGPGPGPSPSPSPAPSRARLEALHLNSCIYIRVSLLLTRLCVSVSAERKKQLFSIRLSRTLRCSPSLSSWGAPSASWT